LNDTANPPYPVLNVLFGVIAGRITNMIAKQLGYLSDALMAGVVMGARVPIALTGRDDDRSSWLASAALVQIVAHMYRQAAVPAQGPS
jgi:hypothetical protein